MCYGARCHPMRRFLALLTVFVVVPASAFMQDASLTRRDGFLMIWESVKRPAAPAKTTFSDVPEEARGSLEIDYARSRNIIQDTDTFRPDEPLLLGNALVWLLRTRNIVDDPSEVSLETIDDLLARYPIADLSQDGAKNKEVTKSQLESLIHLLDTQLTEEEHEVSLYAEKFHGDGTAFGEKFDMHDLTAAHRSFPHNTLVKVTNISNGKSVIVRINDRGPYVHGRDMDLSLAAFTSIEDRSRGKFMARFERLGDVTLADEVYVAKTTALYGDADADMSCEVEATMQRRLGKGVALKDGVPTAMVLGNTMRLSSDKRFVVRGVTYPDGTKVRLQDFILEGEEYALKPSIEGTYEFLVGPIDGRTKTLSMNVVGCGG